MSVLLDSGILIDHLNDVQAATDFIARTPRASISAVTRAEVLVGVRDEEIARITDLLNFFPALAIDSDVAEIAARLRRANGWRLPDAFQAALALHHKLTLATRNTRDFDPAKHSFVQIPYTLPGQEL